MSALTPFQAYDTLLETPRPAGPEELRAIYGAVKSANGGNCSSYEDNGRIISEDISIPLRDGATTTARLHRRKQAVAEPAPLAVIIHGGGYITGDRFDESWTCQMLVEEIGAVALAIEYRLAPEHPFPIPILDVWDAVKWVSSLTWLKRKMFHAQLNSSRLPRTPQHWAQTQRQPGSL